MTADPTMFAGLDRAPAPARALPPGRRWLDRGELACAGCGRAVPAGHDASMTVTEVILDGAHPRAQPVTVTFGKCAACAALDVHARQLAGGDDPVLARLLAGYRILKLGLPDPARTAAADVRRWLGRFTGLDWASKVLNGEAWRTCTIEAWAHVDPGTRAALVAQMAFWTHTRARPGRPVPIRPPVGRGCAMCGLAAVEVPASEAHSIAPETLWRRVSASGQSWGGKDGRRVAGALCGACADACTDAEGRLVLGPSSLESALAAHWEGHGHGAAARMLRFGELGGVVAFAVSGAEPGEPWGHMEIPELESTGR